MEFQEKIPDFKDMNECLQFVRETQSFDDNSYRLLISVFQKVRPDYYGNYKKAEDALSGLNRILKSDRRMLHKFRYLVASQLKNMDMLEIFAESGIESEYNFFTEFLRRLEHKLIPERKKSGSLLRMLDRIFYKKSDYRWIEKIDRNVWVEFFTLLNLRADFLNRDLLWQLSQALHIISCKVVALSSDREIKDRFSKNDIKVLIRQNYLSQQLMDFNRHPGVVREKYSIIKTELLRNLQTSEEIVRRIQDQSVIFGTSLQQTYLLKQMKLLISRIRMILVIANQDIPPDADMIVTLFTGIIKNENIKNSIFRLFRANAQILAYRIAEHEQDTGEHYITTSRKEFYEMLKSSMGGGVFAALMAFIKSIFHNIAMAPFWQGFCYGINYSAGFVGIHISGSTLATKQPAMTASRIAGVMDDKKAKNLNMSELAILLTQVWRSQSASFAGNLTVAFPVALLLAFLYYLIFKVNIAAGEHAQAMLDWQNPLKSSCLLYACNTGVFLYLSGLVTGYVDNHVIHRNIPLRIKEHPFWTRFVSTRRLAKIGDYTAKNMGPIVGNIFLGFCLGMAPFFGYIFGIDFDIRHITISTGQFAIGLQGLGYHVQIIDLIMTIIGILLIGFLNFMVSFTLAFITASISRGINLSQYRHLIIYLRRLLFRYPMDFIFPPSKERTAEDLLKHRKSKNYINI